MVVKHPSEWYHKKESSIWQSFLNKLTSDAPEWREYCEGYLDKMVWMQDASKLKLGSSLWHMHPVVFLGYLSKSSDLINVDAFTALYEKEHVSFSPGTAALTSTSKQNWRKLLVNINDFYSSNQEYIPNLYKLSYMLATARHETYHYTTAEFFSEKPEVGGVNYFNKYDPVLADTQKRKDRAIKMVIQFRGMVLNIAGAVVFI
ncbi:hypothetical protein ACLIN0_05635 [Pantoea agglomerans]|uniref:hypothetical protein n=1 Tax=Enterobacter agglomerans TaxID=549 RepID=UPI003986C9F2